jgi:hypothetical protein
MQRELGWLVDDAVARYTVSGRSLPEDTTWRSVQRQLHLNGSCASHEGVVQLRMRPTELQEAWRRRVQVWILPPGNRPNKYRTLDMPSTVWLQRYQLQQTSKDMLHMTLFDV